MVNIILYDHINWEWFKHVYIIVVSISQYISIKHNMIPIQIISLYQNDISRLILSLRPANERLLYKVTLSLIGWVQANLESAL